MRGVRRSMHTHGGYLHHRGVCQICTTAHMSARLPTVKLALHWNQWLLGAMLDYGRILPVRWIVLVLGPLTISISAGRREPT